MTKEPNAEENRENPPSDADTTSPVPDCLIATQADFDGVDLNRPAKGSGALDCSEIVDLYRKAANDAKAADQLAEYRVYSMIEALCTFHLKPDEPNEPFGPLVTFADGRRSTLPCDFRGNAEQVLLSKASSLENPALRARVSDTLWLLDKSRAASARQALESYLEVINAARDSKGHFRSNREGADFYSCNEILRRALHIARAIGWDNEQSLKARTLLSNLRNDAFDRKSVSDFMWVAESDLDFGVSEPASVATQGETLLPLLRDGHQEHRLLHIAARGHGYAGANDDNYRCLTGAAERLVRIADAGAGSAMYQAHWLERAIQELYRVPGSKERRRELKHKLIDVQSRIPDEFSSFSRAIDLSDVAERARAAISGKSVMAAIGVLSRLAKSPLPDDLRTQALKLIKEHPLSSLFMSTIVDTEGKPIHRNAGAAENSDAAIQHQISQTESIRRTNVANGVIEPVRQTIMEQHMVTEQDFAIICGHSPFVPPGCERMFMKGFARFFQGDMVGAVSILVPQLENSIRYILRSNGYDVVKVNNDMTQEDLDLSALLRMRGPMEQVFGPSLTLDIENVFSYRGGPSVRHSVAHGRFSWNEFHGGDATYGCWLILHMTCLPLLTEWESLVELHIKSIWST